MTKVTNLIRDTSFYFTISFFIKNINTKGLKMQKIKRNFNRYMAMFMAILTLSGVAPLHVFATQNEQSNATSSIFVNGEEVIANENGSFFIGDNLNYEQPVFTHEASTSSTYGTVGAEHVASQIQNTAIVIDSTQMTSNEDGTYTAVVQAVYGDDSQNLVGREIIVTNPEGVPSLSGLTFDVGTNYSYEDYISHREYYFGHSSLTEPINPFARLARVAGTNVGSPSFSNDETWSRAVAIAYVGPQTGALSGDPVLIAAARALVQGNPTYRGPIRGAVTINGVENATGDTSTVFTTSGSATRSL